MQARVPNLPSPQANSGASSADSNLISWIAAQAATQGPVFKLPGVRPAFVLSGQEGLAAMGNPALTERTPSAVPADIALVFSDEDAAVLSATEGATHDRRRGSWTYGGGLDRAGITRALPGLDAIIGSAVAQWRKRGIFSLNLEVRRLVWRLANQMVLGHDGDDRTLAQMETMLDLGQAHERLVAKRRLLDWLQSEARSVAKDGIGLSAQMAASGVLSEAELINEMKHGLVAGLFLWLPVAEALRRVATDRSLAVALSAEVSALSGNFSPASMMRTPRLLELVNSAIRQTSPAPFVYARARTSFTVHGVSIPADALLIGAVQASNQLLANGGGATDANAPAHLAFGVGRHACPAADLSTVTAWLIIARVIEACELQALDLDDTPAQELDGYFARRGCFVQCSSASGDGGSRLPSQPDRRVQEATAADVPLERSTTDRTARVAIVGAGITGLTLAHELRRAGYLNVTVFERDASVGGKADTIQIDGRPYNLGAHLCCASLGVASLARDVGVELEPCPTYELWDIDHNRAIPRDYEHYDQVRRLRRLLAAHPELEQDSGFAAMESWTYAPIRNWLEAQGFGSLQEIGPFFTGAGYGFLEDDVPAAFFLKFAQHMTEDGWTPSGGYKHLLERVAADLDVRCNTDVVSVERGAESEGAAAPSIRIVTRQGDKTQQHAFDRLIVASPLEQASRYLDLCGEEASLFPRVKSCDYYTVIATLDIPQPHPVGLYIVPRNTSDSGSRGRVTAFVRIHEQSTVYHFFFYGEPGQSEESILENLRMDARKLGGELGQVHVFRKWSYAPQVSPHDMALGFHSRLDELQGQRGTYYAGSLLAFELTDHCVLQAKSLVERFFAGNAAAGEPEPVPALAATANDPHMRVPETGTPSILEILRERYEKTPDVVMSVFLNAKGREVRSLTYRELVERSIACAAALRGKGVKPGDRVALVYPPDTDEFLIGFFGCLCASAIAVPVACPDPRNLDVELPRFSYLMKDCDCRVALTNRFYHTIATVGRTLNGLARLGTKAKATWPALSWIRTDGLSPIAPNGRMPIPSPSAETVAYLQYTSGSTSDPKGVMITHGNVLHNVEAIRVQTCVSEQSVLVGWVPLFHDMGLVGGPLTTLYCGAKLVFFSPLTFLQNPKLWIQAMHQYRATHTESPNFGYEFLIRQLADESLDGIDLSCLTHVLFGGEVMRPRTFERLAERLQAHGLNARAMTNIFGAAEGTLFLAGGGSKIPPLLSVATRPLENERRAIVCSPDLHSTTTLIGCGIPPAGCDIRIVDPETTRLRSEGQVGEIWLSSPSVSQGYWGRSTEDNDRIFRARVANDPQPLRTYLRTGDLGFIQHNVLYICGRLKELMIFNGRNIHPMDIELCIMNAHPAIRQGCVVAFAVEEDDQEKLVVVAEIKATATANAAAAAAAITQALLDQHRLSAKAVVLVKSASLPKTSSGKLQRVRARALYQDGRLSVIHTLTPDQPSPSGLEVFDRVEEPDPLDDERFTGDLFATRHWLRRLFAKALQVEPDDIGAATAFSSFGVDSAQAMSLTLRLSKYLGAKVAPSTLYEHQTIDALAMHLCSQSRRDSGELVTLQGGNPDRAPTLFCLHPVGGSAMAYLGLVEQLPTHIPVCAFNNELDETPADDVVQMASRYLHELRQRQACGPYYLLGYSFGGVVAYEMARQLVAAGDEVGGLFMIDTPAPLYREEAPNPGVHEGERFSSFMAQAILNHLIPEHLDDEEREQFRQRIEQNQRALARYRIDPSNSIGLRIVMFRASKEAEYLREAGQHPAFDSPDFGWQQASPQSTIEVRTVPGDHFSVMSQPEALANQLASLLAHTGSMAEEESADRAGHKRMTDRSDQAEVEEVG